MHQLAWVRLMVARHPWVYWLTIAIVAGVVGISASRAVAAVDAARRSWGQQQTVWIASAAVEPGDAIAAERRQVPRAVVPPDAVDVPPEGSVARQHLGPGEIVTTADVISPGSAGLVPAGWVAFAVPAYVEHFAVADHVHVYSGDQLVASGLVVDIGESELMVAIPTTAAPAMATALLANAVIIGLTPGP
jgi:hypothetical protein